MARREKRGAALRVLMVNTVPTIYDGITTVMLNYVGGMDREGVRVDFAVINEVEPSLRERLEGFGGAVYRIPGRNRRPLRYIWRLSRLIRENGCQVVHAHGNSCTLALEMLAARLGGARVRCPHSHNTTCVNQRAHRLLRPLFDRLYTHGFACGEEAGRWLFRQRPFTVLKNGMALERFRFDPDARAACRARLGLEGRIALGHVGLFEARKNHRFLLEAFEKAHAAEPRLALVLVGGGALAEEIRALAARKGLASDVIFAGVSREVPRILSAMDLMALPSLFEGLPNVLVEWQASGLPSLVADTVTREAGLTGLVTFLPLQEDVWVRAILEQAAKPNDRTAASAEAIPVLSAAGYDIRQNAANLKSLYQQYVKDAYK